MKTFLKSPYNTFSWCFIGPATYGRSRPRIRFAKSRKSSKNRQKCDFSKIDILFHSGRKYDIWPEIGPLDPGKSPESLYWSSYTIWSNFKKSQKNPIFDHQNSEKKFFPADYSGRCDPAIKTILGIKTSYMCPKGPIMSPYPHPSFVPIRDFKFSLDPGKIHFFSVFLLYIDIYVSYIYETYFFKISRTSAFRKVYMFWGYLLPLKSYSSLKSCSERGGSLFIFTSLQKRKLIFSRWLKVIVDAR